LSKIYLRKLVESGVHFGHRVSRWNPKMDRYIYGKRNLIHIINLVETVRALTRAVGFLKNICATGQQVVFVGTKRQIKSIIESESKRCIMPYVTERWLGGALTNFQTIRARLRRLEQLEELESTGKLNLYSKKIQASLLRELRRIKKNLDGIREMHRLPGAMVVVDPKNENIAVKEANKLGIPVIAILDTDCDPDEVDIPIPGNDDAIRSVQVLLEKMVDAVNEGKANFDENAAMEARAEEAEEQFELASERRRAQRDQRRGRGGPRVTVKRGEKQEKEKKAAPPAKPAPAAATAAGPTQKKASAAAPAAEKTESAEAPAPAPEAAGKPPAEAKGDTAPPPPEPKAKEVSPAEPEGDTAPPPPEPKAKEVSLAEPEGDTAPPPPEPKAKEVPLAEPEGDTAPPPPEPKAKEVSPAEPEGDTAPPPPDPKAKEVPPAEPESEVAPPADKVSAETPAPSEGPTPSEEEEKPSA
jgi:small subunit ribosomal protein S2